MNTILQKRIEAAAHQYIQSDAVAPENMHLAFGDFINGAKFALRNQWISVEEALPSYNIKVLVCFEPAFGARKIFITTRGHENIIVYEKNKFYIEQSGEVTHWMPVPEFPKGGEK